MRAGITILETMDDPNLFAPHFRNPQDWLAWRVFLSALFGLAISDEQRAIFAACTGRENLSDGGASEAWLVCGRRAGKSFILALIAVFLACFKDWRGYLGPGERGTVMVIAADRRQARVIMRYCKGLLLSVQMLKQLVEAERADGLDLANRISIEVHTASFRTVRGYSIVAALLDELAFWPTDDAAQPDYEVVNALKPGMATIPGAMLLCASSPYSRRGALWDAYRRHFGKQTGAVLVWQAPTRVMNPTVPQRIIDEALASDPARAASEWLAEFRSDLEGFVSREIVEACIEPGVRERPFDRRYDYFAFCDPSGGGSDSFTLAIAHREDDDAVVDLVRERRPPFSPENVAREFSTTLQDYGIGKVIGDKYAGEFPRELFRKQGIYYDASARPKSEQYVDFLALLNSRTVLLPDNDRLVAQLVSLERRTARSGRESIDHAPGAHVDLANAVAGAACLVTRHRDVPRGFTSVYRVRR